MIHLTSNIQQSGTYSLSNLKRKKLLNKIYFIYVKEIILEKKLSNCITSTRYVEKSINL